MHIVAQENRKEDGLVVVLQKLKLGESEAAVEKLKFEIVDDPQLAASFRNVHLRGVVVFDKAQKLKEFGLVDGIQTVTPRCQQWHQNFFLHFLVVENPFLREFLPFPLL